MKNDVGEISMFASKISFGDKKEKNNIDLKTKNVVKKGLIKDLNEVIEIKGNKDDKCNERVKLDGNLFQYDGTAIHIIFEGNKPWFKAKDVAVILEYKNTKEAISYNVSKKNMRKFSTFSKVENSPFEKSRGNIGATIYISKEGLWNLVLESKAKGAKKFKAWVAKLLNKIDDGEEIYEKKESTKDFDIIPNNKFTDWAFTHNSSELRSENVLYLGVIGTIKNISSGLDTNVNEGELIFKYGITFEESRREKEHKNTIDSYTCFYVVKCIKNAKLERDLKFELERKKLLRNIKFSDKRYTELFTTSKDFTIEDIQNFITNWIDKNDYKIDELEVERERTKQEIEKTKQKEYEFKILELKHKIGIK